MISIFFCLMKGNVRACVSKNVIAKSCDVLENSILTDKFIFNMMFIYMPSLGQFDYLMYFYDVN